MATAGKTYPAHMLGDHPLKVRHRATYDRICENVDGRQKPEEEAEVEPDYGFRHFWNRLIFLRIVGPYWHLWTFGYVRRWVGEGIDATPILIIGLGPWRAQFADMARKWRPRTVGAKEPSHGE